MRKVFSILLVLILFSSFSFYEVLAAEEDYDVKKKLVELEAAISKLEAMVKDLNFQVEQMKGLESIVKELSFELKQGESQIRDLFNLEKKVNQELQPRLLSLEGTVGGMAASFREKLDGLSARLFELETTVDGLASRVKVSEERLREFQGRINALEQAAGMLDPAKAQELQARLGKLEELVLGLAKKVHASEAALMTKAEASEVVQLQTQVEKLQREMEAAKKQANTSFVVGVVGVLTGIAALMIATGIISM